MDGKHPLGSLAPRDVVAREIDAELKRSGARCVHLNMTSLDGDYITGRFPGIHARCSALGIDMRKQPIPVVPAARHRRPHLAALELSPWFGLGLQPGWQAEG